MSTLIQLKTARYKGVEFLFQDASTTGGNRLIKYNFPGSDKQAIERQGKAPRAFNLTAIIPSENYYQSRDALLRVLEDGEPGVLTHPTFGDVENVYTGTYTIDETLNELGRGRVTIPFEVDNQPGIPQQSGQLPSQVAEASALLDAQAETDLANQYSVDPNLSGNFSDALDNVANVPVFFTQATELASPIVKNLTAFRAKINVFSASVGDLIQAPAALSRSVSGLFEDLSQLYESPETLLGAFQLLAPFGADDPETPPTTVARVERVRNRDTLRAAMRTQSLSHSYTSASLITYQTTEDLETVLETLEGRYVDLRDEQLLTNEALEELDRARVQAYAALDEARVNTRSIIMIETPLRPLSVLVYEYYGSTELADTIAELNNIKQNAFVEGEIRILAG